MDKPVAWAIFAACVGVLLTLDLGVFHRKNREASAKDAALWSALWIGLALAFNAGVFMVYGAAPAMQFLTGYLLEKALSVDNLFMFLAIFALFRVDPKLQHKALFWGVVGALVMRGVMIAGGIALLERFHWLVYAFGLALVLLSVPMMSHGGAESEPKGFLRAALSRLPGAVDDESGAMLIRVAGRLRPTRLLVAVLAIELVDLVFALESVPAVIAITTDPFIVYTSNVFAILGLRSLYFALAGVMRLFSLLHYGLGLVILFVGLKMLASPFYAVPVQVSLALVALILGVSVLASVVWTKKPAAASGPAWDFGRRVAAGLLLSTALTAVMAAASVRTVSSLSRSKNAMLDASGRQMIAVDRARLAEAQRVGAARGYLLTGDPAFRKKYQEDDRKFTAALAHYGALDTSAETRRLIRGIARNYQEYRGEFETTMELRRAGKDLRSVAQRYERVVEPQRAEVDRILSALVSREAAKFERDRTRSDLATFQANALIYAVAAVLILTGLKLSSAVSDALARSYEEAQETARARGELKASQAAYRELEAVSYAISHNLRAPLRAIDASARATLAAGEPPAGAAAPDRPTLEAVRQSVSRMSRMIESLLELLGVSSGPLAREPVDLSALLCSVFEARAAGLARRPRFFCDPGLSCQADPRLLRAALEKLIDNAVKFSSKAADPYIEAGRLQTEAGPAFFVRDNGAGFDMSHAARLFVPFQRLHRADEFPGAGMGLPVVGRIIERHGGRVWAEAAPGRGATFFFTLP